MNGKEPPSGGSFCLMLTRCYQPIICTPMIDAVTIVIARRRRILAVWAAVCV
jgi:hypothetical protein